MSNEPQDIQNLYTTVGLVIRGKNVNPEELIHALENCIATTLTMSTATADECIDAAAIIAKNIERKYLHLVRTFEDASTPEETVSIETIAAEADEQPIC